MITGLSVFRPGVGSFPVAIGDVIELYVGDTLSVTVSYTYTSPYNVTASFVGYFGSFASKQTTGSAKVTLQATAIPKTGEASINIEADKVGTFGLGVTVLDTNVYDEVPNCIVVAAKPGMIESIMNMVVMMMMMSMIIPMMTGMMGEDNEGF